MIKKATETRAVFEGELPEVLWVNQYDGYFTVHTDLHQCIHDDDGTALRTGIPFLDEIDPDSKPDSIFHQKQAD